MTKYLTSIEELDLSQQYTYADYLTWRFKERIELIFGKVFKMSPAPKAEHQHVSSVLSGEFYNHLKSTNCKYFAAPFDVRLPIKNEKGELNTVVQPDLCIICNPKIIDEKGCNGVPDLVVEIISKNSVDKDLHEKYELYQKCGIEEYWIIHPSDKTLIIHTLINGNYVPSKILTRGDVAESKKLPGLCIELTTVFEDVVYEESEDYSSGEARDERREIRDESGEMRDER